uniref:BART domain-containing protein n=1 Tax=Globisporangium ultimum (strain ATCC 200006 / CBS 805.95 / DAOM BR144) TaxID=431595 RepID=K3WME0_GLOUD
MGDNGFLIDAMTQFLQSSMWLDAVTRFLETHYRLFIPVAAQDGDGDGVEAKSMDDDDAKHTPITAKEYTLDQYEVFLQFKDLVERLLEELIAELGCSGDDLVVSLDESARLGEYASSERRFFIQMLLSFENYHAFHHKIRQFAIEKQETSASTTGIENSKWLLQVAIATSILESKANGQLDETEEGLVAWAEALIQMTQHSSDIASDQVPTVSDNEEKEEAKATESAPSDDRLKELERTLIRERLKVDLFVAQRIADANAQIKQQMLHLVGSEIDDQQSTDDLQTTGDPSKSELARLLAQVEAIQARLKQVKAQCFEFKAVSQPHLDRMYLFLKEKVHYQQDLVSQEKEISDFIFTQIDESDAPLIPLLLEWLLLESEGLRVQTQIQDQLNGARDEGYWIQEWDEGSRAFYYMHSVTQESVWEAPVCGYLDMNQEFVTPAWDRYGETANSSFGTVDQVAESKDTSNAVELGDDESSNANLVSDGSTIEAALDLASTQLNATLQLDDGNESQNQLLKFESVMQRISREHDEERKRLELLFQVEKARQKEELRKRKEKKRRERMAKSKLAKADADDAKEEKVDACGVENKESTDSGMIRDLPCPPLSARGLLQQSPRLQLKAEDKQSAATSEENEFSIVVPGHGRVNLTHLLSDAHAKRFQERKGLSPLQQPPPQALLNPSTLRYLTEKMVKKDPINWGYGTAKQELVLEETETVESEAK